MFQVRSSGMWERDIIALRVIPALSSGEILGSEPAHDAGWLVRRSARIAAIGFAYGHVTGDSEETFIRFIGTQHVAVPLNATGKPLFEEATGFDHECVVLHGVADEMLRHSNPLIVTVGGRTIELPFLRYRALAKGVGLRSMHLVLANRFPYFSRYDPNWHLDLADLLSGYGASVPLTLRELASLAEITARAVPQSLGQRAEAEASRVFALLLRTLRITGYLTPGEYRRAEGSLEEV